MRGPDARSGPRLPEARRGYITLIILIAASVFLWYLDTMVVSVIELQHAQTVQKSLTQAFASAEAGLEQYRWYLLRFPSSLPDTTVASSSYTVSDKDGNGVGTFSLSLDPATYCGSPEGTTEITSMGVSRDGPYSVTLAARFGNPTVASEAYVSSTTQSFSGISALLPTLKGYAEGQGVYFGPSGGYGYRIVFSSNGTFTSYLVSNARAIWGYSPQDGWQEERSVISSVFNGTVHAIPQNCPLIVVDDTVWVEGSVSGRVALVSRTSGVGGLGGNVYLSGTISYANSTGDGLTVIAQKNVLVALQSPDIMRLRGVYVAINGMFGRNEYLASGQHDVPSDLASYVTRSSLSVFGTVMSYASSTVKWYDSHAAFASGYLQASYVMDGALAKFPPPFAPVSSTTPRFLDWEQTH